MLLPYACEERWCCRRRRISLLSTTTIGAFPMTLWLPWNYGPKHALNIMSSHSPLLAVVGGWALRGPRTGHWSVYGLGVVSMFLFTRSFRSIPGHGCIFHCRIFVGLSLDSLWLYRWSYLGGSKSDYDLLVVLGALNFFPAQRAEIWEPTF